MNCYTCDNSKVQIIYNLYILCRCIIVHANVSLHVDPYHAYSTSSYVCIHYNIILYHTESMSIIRDVNNLLYPVCPSI